MTATSGPVIPEEYRGEWVSVTDAQTLEPGDIIRGPAHAISGDVIARVVNVGDGDTAVDATVVHVITPTTNGLEIDQRGGIHHGGPNTYVFHRFAVRKLARAGHPQAVGWRPVTVSELRPGMPIRARSRAFPDDPARTVTGEVLEIRLGGEIVIGQSSTDTPRNYVNASHRILETRDSAVTSRNLPEWAQGKTLDEVRKYIYDQVVTKYDGGSGSFCGTGARDFLDMLDLPTLEAGWPDPPDEQEEIRTFVRRTRQSLIAAGRAHSHPVDEYLRELGFIKPTRESRITVPEDVTQDQITAALRAAGIEVP